MPPPVPSCYSEGVLSIPDRREGVKGAKGGRKSIMARRYVRLVGRGVTMDRLSNGDSTPPVILKK